VSGLPGVQWLANALVATLALGGCLALTWWAFAAGSGPGVVAAVVTFGLYEYIAISHSENVRSARRQLAEFRAARMRGPVGCTPLPNSRPTGPRSQAIPPHTHLHKHTAEPPSLAVAAETLYAALGPEGAGRAHRALVPIAHPDAGGSVEVMAELNAARDRGTANGRGRRSRRPDDSAGGRADR
jgi:hypothetical protein